MHRVKLVRILALPLSHGVDLELGFFIYKNGNHESPRLLEVSLAASLRATAALVTVLSLVS